MLNKLTYFKSADGIEIPSYDFIPDKPAISSILLLYEIFGVTEHMKKTAKMLANKGYLVKIPDIYDRLEKEVVLPYNEEGLKKGIILKKELGWDIPVMDIVSCAALLKQNNKVTVMGFCFGGSLAWRSAQKSFIFDNAICYYGSSISEFLDKNLNSPAIIHFGKNDKSIPPNAVEKVKRFCNQQKYDIKVFEYDNAEHGFNCDERKSYNQEAANMAMDRNLDFLRSFN